MIRGAIILSLLSVDVIGVKLLPASYPEGWAFDGYAIKSSLLP